ncbi:MAG TPA: DNA polymerase [Candidatus Paceibacterota bacterium]|nr:DNA polymerase [Candidatus Paceibacterota bacterium]
MKKSSNKKRLVLLDAHAIIHRAYHALPDFTSPSGEPTGALYGLVSMLLKIITDLKPDFIAACYDLPKPTIRHEAYAGYKGTRAKTDDALAAQLQSSRNVFEAFCIPLYEREGFEADDLLGTIAAEVKEKGGTEVIIASGDMDTLQLVDDDTVKVYTLKKGINDTILYDAKAVQARYGFPPNLIPDWKGLRGDPSDNIKGIPGVGEKTATDLITKFGTIEQIYKQLKKDENVFLKKGIKARMVGLLKEHEEDAVFSKMLATIRLDAPIAFKLPPHDWLENVDAKKVLALFDLLGFRSLRERAKSALQVGAARESESADIALAEEVAEEKIDDTRLAEAKVMLWLISSEFTNPSREDIFAFTKKEKFAEAYAVLEKKLADSGRVQEVYEHIEKPLIPILKEMKEYGVLIDPAVLQDLQKRYQKELGATEARIYKQAGHEFNVSSPKQLGVVLFDELGLTPERQKKTAGGERSTRESELEKIRDLHPIVSDILEFREIRKLLSTYIENILPLLDEGHRLHAEFLQTGSATGRMAGQNPNLQNIPIQSERGRAIRHAFVAAKGTVLVALDYSQIELRLAAILSGDEKLCDIFRNGRDVHREVAAHVFHVPPEKVDSEMRRRAKVINFGILYGMGVNALRAQLGTTTAEAHAFYEEYFGQFKELAEYLERTKGFARKHGYTETLFGRRRQFPEMKSKLPYVVAQAERMAINAPIQGTSADIIKLAMVRVRELFEKEGVRDDAHILLSVHDELVIEIRESCVKAMREKIKDVMESIVPKEESRGVPVTAEMKVGPNWGDLTHV